MGNQLIWVARRVVLRLESIPNFNSCEKSNRAETTYFLSTLLLWRSLFVRATAHGRYFITSAEERVDLVPVLRYLDLKKDVNNFKTLLNSSLFWLVVSPLEYCTIE